MICQRYSVLLFYCLAFLISWIGWAPVLVLPSVSFIKVFLLLPCIGPGLAAIITIGLVSGIANSREFIHHARRWSGKSIDAFIALLLPIVLVAVGSGITHIFGFSHTDVLKPSGMHGIFLAFIFALAANPWEELGLRGFALPRLQAQFGITMSTLIIAALWGLWHLPLFYWPESPMSHYLPWEWFMALVPETFILTWLFNRTAPSIGPVTIFHVTYNVAAVAIGISSFVALAACNTIAALFLFAISDNHFVNLHVVPPNQALPAKSDGVSHKALNKLIPIESIETSGMSSLQIAWRATV